MGSRTIATVVTADTMALNAAVFGYAGHSLVTPHAAIQQVWWTEERINAKVTREFISSKLRLEERQRVHRPLAFGDGLTDDTYLDWILARAKRLFLIMVECGVPNEIFNVVDASWDDDDLPIPLADITRLSLFHRSNERLHNKFHSTQFQFLLRPLHAGGHVDYASNEVIPIDFVHRLAPAAALQHWTRIHMPKLPETVYTRRKIPLGDPKAEMDPAAEAQFHADIRTARSLSHRHIAPVWASYTAQNYGYIIGGFQAEHTLKSFIEFRSPTSFQKVEKSERHAIMMGWMHCLAETVAWLHQNGTCHSAILPSNIVINAANEVAFSDVGCLKTFQKDKKRDPAEPYNYGAPENHPSSAGDESIIRPGTSAGRSIRSKMSTDSKGSSDARSSRSHDSQTWDRSSSSGNSIMSADSRSLSVPSTATEATFKLSSNTTPTLSDPWPLSPASPNDFSFNLMSPALNLSLTHPGFTFQSNASEYTVPLSPRLVVVPPPADEKSDIFALGCVYLDILTFIFKKKSYSEFVKYRSTKYKQAKGSRIDASFHGNREKVLAWISALESENVDRSDPIFAAMPHLFRLIRMMLNPSPEIRPTAAVVRDRLFDILISQAKIPNIHCAGEIHAIDFPPPQPNLVAAVTMKNALERSVTNDYPVPLLMRPPVRRIGSAPMVTGGPAVKTRTWRKMLIGVR